MFLLFSLVCLLSTTQASSMKEPWGPLSSPELMSHQFQYDFQKLPLYGFAYHETNYWSGGYWNNKKGSINYRWNAEHPRGFNLDSPSKEKLSTMSLTEISKLAPSEKYDLYIGRYDYPLRKEVEKWADTRALSWEGICHGWAPASMNHPEPLPKTLLNPDGFQIPFGSSDIKAILSFFYAYGFEVPDTHQMGRRCMGRGPSRSNSDCYEDLNAGALHLVLANKIGRLGEGIIGDMNRYQEVWNHPIISYYSDILENDVPPHSSSAIGTKKRVKIRTKITYIDGTSESWNPVRGTSKQKMKSKYLFYYLEIDGQGKIIGGDWTSKDRIDFIWIKEPPKSFSGLYYGIKNLIK